MKFCANNWEDIKRYFDKSYMKFPFTGDEVLYVESVTPNGLSGKQLPRNGEDGWMFTFDDKERDIEFILPRKSYFEHNGMAMLLARLPTKQYKRGLCRDNVSIVALTQDGFMEVPISLEVINSYAGKPAFSGFKMDRIGTSYAVSPRMAVDPIGRVFIDRTRIGYIEVKTGTININSELFVPEVERVIRENGQYVLKVVCKKKQPTKEGMRTMNGGVKTVKLSVPAEDGMLWEAVEG